ncbi:rCG47665, partial [Rattus norvegicus]
MKNHPKELVLGLERWLSVRALTALPEFNSQQQHGGSQPSVM